METEIPTDALPERPTKRKRNSSPGGTEQINSPPPGV